MPIYYLDDDRLDFPPVTEAEEDGLLAVGGDLRPARLIAAYQHGIFPWFSEDDPPLWWSPDPRCVLFPEKLHIPRSLRPILNAGKFHVTFNTHFSAVIRACRESPRPGQDGTWITPEMEAAYIQLHQMGWAHSVEVWQADELAGGLYGVMMGRTFCGESMFTRVPNAAKVGFVHWVAELRARGVTLIDCQVPTDNLLRFGAETIPRARFLRLLRAGLKAKVTSSGGTASDTPR